MGMGNHQSSRALKEEWLTPPYVLDALGPFDLDPCAPVRRPWDMAAEHYTILDDGLSRPWRGRVWLNPPYGDKTDAWLSRLADHGDGIALIFARTETDAFFEQVWARADALLFLRGRLTFHHADGRRANANGGAPSVLIAYGRENADRLESCRLVGALMRAPFFSAGETSRQSALAL
ncbi:MAG: DNA N-6-adenine-methyltransferase [Salinisphaeraceae bacterium]